MSNILTPKEEFETLKLRMSAWSGNLIVPKNISPVLSYSRGKMFFECKIKLTSILPSLDIILERQYTNSWDFTVIKHGDKVPSIKLHFSTVEKCALLESLRVRLESGLDAKNNVKDNRIMLSYDTYTIEVKSATHGKDSEWYKRLIGKTAEVRKEMFSDNYIISTDPYKRILFKDDCVIIKANIRL